MIHKISETISKIYEANKFYEIHQRQQQQTHRNENKGSVVHSLKLVPLSKQAATSHFFNYG